MKLSELLGDAYKDGMTTEEIAAALEAVDAPQAPVSGNVELERMKNAISKANSEAAAYKKQLQARMSEDELRKAEQEAKEAEMQKKFAELQREQTIAKLITQHTTLGYEPALAQKVATYFADGDYGNALLAQKQHMDTVEKRIRAEMLKSTPKPAAGSSVPKDITREQFDNMSYMDRLNLYNENQDLYNELNGG